MSEVKSKMLTLRLDNNQESYIEGAMKLLEDSRGPGARRVTKTETVLILMSYGMDVFNEKYGNPLKTKKKKTA